MDRVSMPCTRWRMVVLSSMPTGSVSGLLLCATGGGGGASTALTAAAFLRRRAAASAFSRSTRSSSSCSLVLWAAGCERSEECSRGLHAGRWALWDSEHQVGQQSRCRTKPPAG